MIIASLTTIPSRIDLLKPILDSVLNQTIPIDHIEINIPYTCLRTEEEYTIPEWMETMDKLLIFRTTDYGAITKIAPTLLRHRGEPIGIWSIDDDFVLFGLGFCFVIYYKIYIRCLILLSQQLYVIWGHK